MVATPTTALPLNVVDVVTPRTSKPQVVTVTPVPKVGVPVKLPLKVAAVIIPVCPASIFF